MRVPILLVIPEDAPRPPLENLSEHSQVVATISRSADVRPTLHMHRDVRVVLTAATLPDGNWLTVLQEVIESEAPAELVILAKSADTNFRLRATRYGVFDIVEEGDELDAHWDIIVQSSVHDPFSVKAKESLP